MIPSGLFLFQVLKYGENTIVGTSLLLLHEWSFFFFVEPLIILGGFIGGFLAFYVAHNSNLPATLTVTAIY